MFCDANVVETVRTILLQGEKMLLRVTNNVCWLQAILKCCRGKVCNPKQAK